MRKIIFTLLLSIIASASCFSQDTIAKRNGENIQAKVLEVSPAEIRYKKFDNPDGPTFLIPKTEVLMLRYENGTRDIFTEEKKTETSTPEPDDLYIHGQRDASKYYRGYKMFR